MGREPGNLDGYGARRKEVCVQPIQRIEGRKAEMSVNISAQLRIDIMEYMRVRDQYSDICAACESSRERSVAHRETRRKYFFSKIEAGENVLMTVMNEFGDNFEKMGLSHLYRELTAGRESPWLLFRLADETTKLVTGHPLDVPA